MNNETPRLAPQAIEDIKLGHNPERRLVFVQIGAQTLMLAPEAAHARPNPGDTTR